MVPGSGGKDSGYVSHLLKYKYGMNPLTVTWAPHIYTEIGWRNFEQWIHTGGLDNILFTPNGKLHRTLTKNFFEFASPISAFYSWSTCDSTSDCNEVQYTINYIR